MSCQVNNWDHSWNCCVPIFGKLYIQSSLIVMTMMRNATWIRKCTPLCSNIFSPWNLLTWLKICSIWLKVGRFCCSLIKIRLIFLFFCLEIFVPLGNVSLIRDVNIAGEGRQILTCARQLWPFSSEGSLACHPYYDTGHPITMFISEDPSHLLPCF